MSTRSNQLSSLDSTTNKIKETIEQSIAGLTIDTTVLLSRVPPEDREVVGNVIKAVSLACSPPSPQGSVGSPYHIDSMKSSGTEREYAVGVSIGTELLTMNKIVDMVRVVHPVVLNIFIKANTGDTRHPFTITVHIACGGNRNIIDAILIFSSRPQGSYTSALTSGLEYSNLKTTGSENSATQARFPSDGGDGKGATNGNYPPHPKKRKLRDDTEMEG